MEGFCTKQPSRSLGTVQGVRGTVTILLETDYLEPLARHRVYPLGCNAFWIPCTHACRFRYGL